MRVEEEYQDVLQNIEYAVAEKYRRNPGMTDYAVLRTYEALAQSYAAELAGRPAKSVDAEGLEADLLRDVKQVCEWRLGRGPCPFVHDGVPKITPVDVQTLTLCLKRLIRSVNKWNKHGGRQGYLSFISQFV